MKSITPEQIDALLPQTQCGLCGYGGCMPYAEALVYEQAPINLCPPGGVKTLRALGALMTQDPAPFEATMAQQAKPKMLAVIREKECIGCTKCIQACPVDAIIGTAKQMHAVLTDECTGCELCVAPCPVDCIDMINVADSMQPEQSQHARLRFQARNERLKQEKLLEEKRLQASSTVKHKSYIEAAIARAQLKKKRTL